MPALERTTARATLVLLLFGIVSGTASAAVPDRIVFPVVGRVSFQDDFGAPRGTGPHEGNDIMSKRKAPVVAVERGVAEKHVSSRTGDCMLYLYGRRGTEYVYIHLNNDLTARNDNEGGCRNGVSWAPGLRARERVRAGQLVGYAGDSGNANGIHPHLHFELHPNGGAPVTPYPWLERARRVLFAVPAATGAVRLRLRGRFRSAEGGLAVRVTRVVAVGHWRGSVPPRRVRLLLTGDLVVERLQDDGHVAPATLASASVGERVTVWTPTFEPTLATQLGRPGALTAKRLRLRGLG
jgi:hypothetical protein